MRAYSGALSIRAVTETRGAPLTTVLPWWECASAEIPPGRMALRRLRECGEAGIPARLVDLDLWSGADLAGALDFYLTCPTLETPIEPWHSLAVAVSGGSPCDLWHAEAAVVGSSVYIAAQGLATLSARLARHGQWFGGWDETWERWRCSALWRELEGHRRALFLMRTDCAFCPAFPWCGGFWTVPGADDRMHCEAWRGLVARLVAVAYEAMAPGPGGADPVGT